MGFHWFRGFGKHRGKDSRGTRGHGSGGTGGSDHSSASSTKSYHNGGVEGRSFENWYAKFLAPKMAEISQDTACHGDTSGGNASASSETVLDLSNAGAVKVLNVTTAADGTFSGSVEFWSADMKPVGVGHFNGVDRIIEPEDTGSRFYTVDDLQVIGSNGAGQPPKVALDQFIEDGDDCVPGTGGTKGSGTGGTRGSGTGGTRGSGSGGTKGSGSGGTKGSGSGGTKGSGSGGTKGSGSCGTKGSASGGTKGSGATTGSGCSWSAKFDFGTSCLPDYVPHLDDEAEDDPFCDLFTKDASEELDPEELDEIEIDPDLNIL
ncbi:hypothetical protein [Litorisediminicola beolgyonensis]|uniref:Uncharacterized protein n=1 Tax=Litorisediminicola beolgyonensis TaxID=1173614 RepID=A0ABW3ZIE4_9RHOB